MTHFNHSERIIFRPIVIILAKFSTQIYNFEHENHEFKIHIYIYIYIFFFFLLKYHTDIYNLNRKPHPIFAAHPYIHTYKLPPPTHPHTHTLPPPPHHHHHHHGGIRKGAVIIFFSLFCFKELCETLMKWQLVPAFLFYIIIYEYC